MTEENYAKPQVATDAGDTLGTIITSAEKRDAIHLAVENVVAAERINPGEDVYLDDDGRGRYAAPGQRAGVGIVDPFLKAAVVPGEHFWLVVYPRQISSLRHVWEHPSFPASGETDAAPTERVPDPIEASISKEILEGRDAVIENARESLAAWIENSELPGEVNVDNFIALIVDGTRIPGSGDDDDYRGVENSGDGWITVRGRDAYGEIPDTIMTLVEVISGKTLSSHKRPTSISCSC